MLWSRPMKPALIHRKSQVLCSLLKHIHNWTTAITMTLAQDDTQIHSVSISLLYRAKYNQPCTHTNEHTSEWRNLSKARGRWVVSTAVSILDATL